MRTSRPAQLSATVNSRRRLSLHIRAAFLNSCRGGQLRRLRSSCRRCIVVLIITTCCFLSIGCGGGAVNHASSPGSAASLSPNIVSFANQVLDTTSAGQTIALTNTGNSALSLKGIDINGDFAQTNTCGAVLLPGASCTFTVTFTPTAPGTRTGTLSIIDNAPGSPQRAILSGAGIAPGQLSAKPTSIAFGTVMVESTSTRTVQLSNTGTSSLTVSAASTSGPGFNITGLAFPLTLAAGQSANVSVTFTPSSTGVANGDLQLTNSGTVSPVLISLNGTGAAPVAHYVVAAWNPSTSTVIGYNVHRSSQSGGPYTKINSAVVLDNSYTDSNVASGLTYFYVVTSVDANNVESEYSNQASATISAS